MSRHISMVVCVSALAGCGGAATERAVSHSSAAGTVHETQAVQSGHSSGDGPWIGRTAPIERIALDVGSIRGLSGLTRDDDGVLWAIPEEDRVLVRIDPADRSIHRMPLSGVPEDIETEAITWLGGGMFALGTESLSETRTADPLLIVELGEQAASVKQKVKCDYSMWKVHAEANHGIEGLCAAGSHVLVATEVVGTADGRRYAPLGRHTRDAPDSWTTYRLWLTSDEGKLAGISCRERNGRLEVLAIERHFGIVHLLRFEIPATGGDVTPRVLVDLDARLAETANYEGVVWTQDGRIALVADNYYRGKVSGPTEMLIIGSDGTDSIESASGERRSNN